MDDEKDRNQYRSDVREVVREGWWTLPRVGLLFAAVLIALSALGFVLSSVNKVGTTIVERTVFENSYQRSEALNSQLATDEATLTQIETQLLNPNLDENTRFNLEAQAAAARLRIETTKRKQ